MQCRDTSCVLPSASAKKNTLLPPVALASTTAPLERALNEPSKKGWGPHPKPPANPEAMKANRQPQGGNGQQVCSGNRSKSIPKASLTHRSSNAPTTLPIAWKFLSLGVSSNERTKYTRDWETQHCFTSVEKPSRPPSLSQQSGR